MSRRLASISLLCAWLCASGAMLDVAQAFAWGRMFAGYTKTESVVSAARDTFDASRPCSLCLAVKAAREASSRHSPEVQTTDGSKVVLAFVDTGIFVDQSAARNWSRVPCSSLPARAEDVPLPPPRQGC
ncbi:MAG TPA: hypothetical protein VFE25_16525 [Opitutaceae bacterium]|jgi:hypothetical protein|nr:hypothetical protein [Opitutaceae bacterium]